MTKTRQSQLAALWLLMLFVSLLIFSSCAQPATLPKPQDDKLIIEQYFYSKNEAALKKLADKLKSEGYGINDFRSYELDGNTEWYFYSTREITQSQIAEEDSNSERYATEFGVGYDGHGFPLE